MRRSRPSIGLTSRLRKSRSIRAGVDDLAARLGGQGAPGAEGDAVLDELDRAVEEGHVHPARVVRAGADLCAVDDRTFARAAGGGEVAGRLVRRLEMAVAAPEAGKVID